MFSGNIYGEPLYMNHIRSLKWEALPLGVSVKRLSLRSGYPLIRSTAVPNEVMHLPLDVKLRSTTCCQIAVRLAYLFILAFGWLLFGSKTRNSREGLSHVIRLTCRAQTEKQFFIEFTAIKIQYQTLSLAGPSKGRITSKPKKGLSRVHQ